MIREETDNPLIRRKQEKTVEDKSLSITGEKLRRLKDIIPEAFTENKIDWEKLKAALSDDIEFKNERYVLNWAGKSDAFRALQSPSTATLAACREESVNFDKTGNVFIEGENLEVLKVLQKSYFGRIKMIYIDPPYNTGNDNFIYPDKFSETKEEYLSRIGDKDETGFMTREGLFRKNSKDSGHYHSNWLSMMYPRLFLARNLLRDDGVIFVSIDDNEVHNLRLMMNEVFGEENFISNIVWKKKTGAGSGINFVFDEHEYVLVYGKNIVNLSKWRIFNEEDGNFKNPDNDERGPWESCAITAPSKNKNPNQLYLIEIYLNNDVNVPEKDDKKRNLIYDFKYLEHTIAIRECNAGDAIAWEDFDEKHNIARFIRRWSYTKDSIKDIFEQKRVYINGKNIPRFKKFESDYEGKALRSIYFNDFSTQEGSDSLYQLFAPDESPMEYPKPPSLIKHFSKGCCSKNDIIFDCFSGSCTTAHAVLDLNKEDGGNRKFICVQIPEKCDESSEAFKSGYKTIAEIGKERIRRVIKKIKEEQEEKLDFGGMAEKQDLGFKVFKLRESNFKIWRSKIETESELVEQLQLHLEPLDEHAKIEDVLYELLLKSGISLTAKIEKKSGYILVNDNEVALMLEKADDKIIKEVIAEKPGKVITLDRLFKNNDQLKTNTALQMKDAGIEFKAV